MTTHEILSMLKKISPTSSFESCRSRRLWTKQLKHKLTHLDTGTGNPCAGHKSASAECWG